MCLTFKNVPKISQKMAFYKNFLKKTNEYTKIRVHNRCDKKFGVNCNKCHFFRFFLSQ